MKPHTKIYMDFFGFKITTDCECEICGSPAVDVNHIFARGMGGDPTGRRDVIENLIGMCREHHVEYGDVKGSIQQMLLLIHLKFMLYRGLKHKILELTPGLTSQIAALETEINKNC
jgi:hypothetical protein